ncbi:MAG: glycoside hydrolase [Acidobacteria bacterium]|nr:glycoside hydrolase [Acidobacteriota bacterium]
MKWRNIGPARGGRTKAAAGHPSQPFTFYVGVSNGGVWKTNDAGRTWNSVWDDQPSGSIGAVVVAPSDANTVYVGSGEGLLRPDLSVGDGMYKSTDAGKTWTHLGLRDAQQIPNIAVDPRNADRVFVAAQGHPYGPNEERGIFRSTDGGKTFQKVLYKSPNIGGGDVDIDPTNSNIIYATLWDERHGMAENVAFRGNGGGIYKSVDGGDTWKEVLPGVTQVNLAIAPSDPMRLYATVANGAGVTIQRSDDAGITWKRISDDNRPAGRIGGGDLPVPAVDPKNPEHVIMASTVSYQSYDGARSWMPFKGSPGGDDYQNVWINPENPNIILMVADQGAHVSLNGGQTWGTWYNQPTAQLYHVNADNDFPYRVCGGQQESGSACVSSRGNDGQITFREWHPVGVEEYGYAVPDPLDPNIVYGGKVTRYDRRTTQLQQVGPVAGGRGGAAAPGTPSYRQLRTAPVVFSTVDPRAMFFANNFLWKTIDGGINWTRISDDPTRKTWEIPASVKSFGDQIQVTQRGVIYTIAPSYTDINRIWVGTDDGVISTTADGGKTWADVTPPMVRAWDKVSIIDTGHTDALTAYAAINTLRVDDMRPHIVRTHDGGKTWTEIVNGLPNGAPVNAVRADPKKKGLLFASTETSVHVSFDDGDHWQSLRLNMPASSVRDIIVKDDDLVAGTHGRGIWILDDITPLRQIDGTTANLDVVLYKPQNAWRVRWNTNTDTPLQPDEQNLPNPPEGAIINYYLKGAANGPVTLEIVHAGDGKLVKKYSSTDPVDRPDPSTSQLPLYWFRPPVVLGTSAGMHRFAWDVRYGPLPGAGGGGGRGGLPIAAVPRNTVPAATTPFAAPGEYIAKLTVNGQTYSQNFMVKLDPRVKTPAPVMSRIFTETKSVYYGAIDAQTAGREVQAVRDQIAKLKGSATGALLASLEDFDKRAADVQGQTANAGGGRAGGAPGRAGGAGRGGGAPSAAPAPAAPAAPAPTAPSAPSFASVSTALAGQIMALQAADVQPTALAQKGVTDALAQYAAVTAKWNAMKGAELTALNSKLRAAKLAEITR